MADPSTDAPQAAPPSPPPLPSLGRWAGIGLMVVLAGVLALNVAWVARHFGLLRAVGPGKKAPDFDLRTLQGDRIRLSDLRGRVVLIDFWSVTCPPCLKTLPRCGFFDAYVGQSRGMYR